MGRFLFDIYSDVRYSTAEIELWYGTIGHFYILQHFLAIANNYLTVCPGQDSLYIALMCLYSFASVIFVLRLAFSISKGVLQARPADSRNRHLLPRILFSILRTEPTHSTLTQSSTSGSKMRAVDKC